MNENKDKKVKVSKKVQEQVDVWVRCLGLAFASDEMQTLNRKKRGDLNERKRRNKNG